LLAISLCFDTWNLVGHSSYPHIFLLEILCWFTWHEVHSCTGCDSQDQL